MSYAKSSRADQGLPHRNISSHNWILFRILNFSPLGTVASGVQRPRFKRLIGLPGARNIMKECTPSCFSWVLETQEQVAPTRNRLSTLGAL